jgi:serine/threonine protein kinase
MSEKIGSFQVLGNLGEGAHSTILHIRRNSDGRQYAIKIVKIETADEQKFLEQAEHEYEVAGKLDHPNLIKIFALEKIKSLGLIGSVKEVRQLIEFVNGKTLDKFKILPLPILLQIFRDVASGLVMMHRRNICHGDIKPNNIMLSRSGNVKVIDYGLSWIKGQDKMRVQGTPEYMAPEQVKQRVVNEKTDIFNLGATMYRLLTWHYIPTMLPLGPNAVVIDEATWKKQLKPVRQFLPDCPDRLAMLVEKCLPYKALHRIECMNEVHEELDVLAKKHVTSENDELKHWEWELE